MTVHLLGIDGMDRARVEELLELTDTFDEIGRRPIPRVPALRGKTVATLFFEDSTRTRLSFDAAAKRLSADTLNFAAGASSLSKGESLRDTVDVIASYGVDALVVRHPMAGTPHRIADWTVRVVHDLDAVLPGLDACYLLRMQQERITEGLIPSIREYVAGYGLDAGRAARLPKDALILHPGPTNRGVEISAEVAADPRSVILDQVVNGVSVRMAVLFLLLGSGLDHEPAADGEVAG